MLAYVFLLFLLGFLDQASKWFAVQRGDVFMNDQFAFSLDVPIVGMYLIYAFLLSVLGYWFYNKKSKTKLEKVAFVFILAGALSNIIERVVSGAVIDFITVFNGILNLADFYIIIGILLLIFKKD